MERKNKKKTSKLNWFTITRKYWKEQLFFYFLTTLSCLGAFLIDVNTWKAIIGSEKSPYKFRWEFFNKEFRISEFSSRASYITLVIITTIVVITSIAILIVVAIVVYSWIIV